MFVIVPVSVDVAAVELAVIRTASFLIWFPAPWPAELALNVTSADPLELHPYVKTPQSSLKLFDSTSTVAVAESAPMKLTAGPAMFWNVFPRIFRLVFDDPPTTKETPLLPGSGN